MVTLPAGRDDVRFETLVTVTGGGGASECVFFTNTSKHVATHIAFAFDQLDGNDVVTQTDAFG